MVSDSRVKNLFDYRSLDSIIEYSDKEEFFSASTSCFHIKSTQFFSFFPFEDHFEQKFSRFQCLDDINIERSAAKPI